MKEKIVSLAICFIFLTIVPNASPGADVGQRKYKSAYKSFKSLEVSKVKRRYRHNWISCAKKFEEVYKKYPQSSWADDAMFMEGRTYIFLYGYSGKKSDLKKAIQLYRGLIAKYPKSKFSDDAQFRIAVIYEKYIKDKSKAYTEYSKVVSNFPRGNVARKAKLKLAELKRYKPKVVKKRPSQIKKEKLSLVSRIRHWSNPEYTRVVIDVEKKVSFSQRLLKRDPSIKKPQRLYVDLANAWIRPGLEHPIPVRDGLLKMVRAGQHTKDSVRIVLDIESIGSYKVVPLEDPFRIVIDVTDEKSSAIGVPNEGVSQQLSLSRQLGLSVGKIVIDPGHGGHDPGAIGPTGLKEKDVVLKIAKKMEEVIKKEIDCEVVLTRRDDRFIPLEERTAIANTERADLFISIHANASPNRDAHGIETYLLNFSSDEEAVRVAARENATSTKKISDLLPILQELMQNSKVNESTRLAGYVQESLVKTLRTDYSKVKDLGVKQAPFYVLIGAKMPSILVEVSFLSNKREEKRLKVDKYLGKLASSISKGIKEYIDEMKVAAY